MRSRSWPITMMTLLAAASVAVGLSACMPSAPAPALGTSSPSASSASATPTASASTAAAGPLQCADLIEQREVVAAFTRSGTTATGSAEAITPYDSELTGPVAVVGAGGAACAWSVRTSAWDGPSGTLLVQVLPGAASQWGALMYGDGPTSDRREYAGIVSAATCGDPGCGASAVVGSSWVRVDMTIPGFGGEHSAFGRESEDAILAGASPTISRVFTTVQRATAAQLDFPEHPGSSAGASRCESVIPTERIAPLLSSSAAHYQLRPLDGQTYSISGAASQDLGSFSCFAQGTSTVGSSTAEFTVAPGQAWAVEAMEGSRYFDSPPLRPTRLAGAAGSDTAETTCVDRGTNECTTVFSLGDVAIEVDGTKNATRIAEAIIASAR